MTRMVITRGVVLGKRSVGEANSLVFILTEKCGVVRALARSSRYERSKLRYGLEPLTYARFSLVRGKHEWKITGVVEAEKVFAKTPSSRLAMGRIARLLMRLIQGEDAAPALFVCVLDGLQMVGGMTLTEDRAGAESVVVLRILHLLGYVSASPDFIPYLSVSSLDRDVVTRAMENRSLLVRAINSSLSATGL